MPPRKKPVNLKVPNPVKGVSKETMAQWPWKSCLHEVQSLLETIGPPFVLHEGISYKIHRWPVKFSQKLQTFAFTPEVQTRAFEELQSIASFLIRKGVPSKVLRDFTSDQFLASGYAAILSASVEGLLEFLQREFGSRQALLNCIQNITAPPLDRTLTSKIKTDCGLALKELNRALRVARKAKSLLAPVEERLLSRKSTTRKSEEKALMDIILNNTTLSKNEASIRAAELLKCLNPAYSTKASTLRVSTYS